MKTKTSYKYSAHQQKHRLAEMQRLLEWRDSQLDSEHASPHLSELNPLFDVAIRTQGESRTRKARNNAEALADGDHVTVEAKKFTTRLTPQIKPKRKTWVESSKTLDLENAIDVGQAWFEPQAGLSGGVGMEIDVQTDHTGANAVDPEAAATLISQLLDAAIPWLRITASTRGEGYHLVVLFDQPIYTGDRQGHGRLAKAVAHIIEMLVSKAAGERVEVVSKLDKIGGILWLWSTRCVRHNNGFAKIQDAEGTLSAEWLQRIGWERFTSPMPKGVRELPEAWETFGYSPSNCKNDKNREGGFCDDFDVDEYRKTASGKFDEEADIEQLLLEDGFEESAYADRFDRPGANTPGSVSVFQYDSGDDGVCFHTTEFEHLGLMQAEGNAAGYSASQYVLKYRCEGDVAKYMKWLESEGYEDDTSRLFEAVIEDDSDAETYYEPEDDSGLPEQKTFPHPALSLAPGFISVAALYFNCAFRYKSMAGATIAATMACSKMLAGKVNLLEDSLEMSDEDRAFMEAEGIEVSDNQTSPRLFLAILARSGFLKTIIATAIQKLFHTAKVTIRISEDTGSREGVEKFVYHEKLADGNAFFILDEFQDTLNEMNTKPTGHKVGVIKAFKRLWSAAYQAVSTVGDSLVGREPLQNSYVQVCLIAFSTWGSWWREMNERLLSDGFIARLCVMSIAERKKPGRAWEYVRARDQLVKCLRYWDNVKADIVESERENEAYVAEERKKPIAIPMTPEAFAFSNLWKDRFSEWETEYDEKGDVALSSILNRAHEHVLGGAIVNAGSRFGWVGDIFDPAMAGHDIQTFKVETDDVLFVLMRVIETCHELKKVLDDRGMLKCLDPKWAERLRKVTRLAESHHKKYGRIDYLKLRGSSKIRDEELLEIIVFLAAPNGRLKIVGKTNDGKYPLIELRPERPQD